MSTEAGDKDAHLVGFGGVNAGPFFDGARFRFGVGSGEGVEPGELNCAIFISGTLAHHYGIVISTQKMQVKAVIIGEADARARGPHRRRQIVDVLLLNKLCQKAVVFEFWLILGGEVYNVVNDHIP